MVFRIKSRIIKRFSLIIGSLLLTCCLFGQVDVSKYTSDDFFEVKPIINASNPDALEEQSEEFEFQSHIQKGFDFLKKGELDEAIHFFRQQTDDYGYFTYLVGLIYFEKGELDEAIDYFEQSLDTNPLRMEAAYMHGMALGVMGKYREANKKFRPLTEVAKYKAHGYHGLAIMNRDQRSYSMAIRNLKMSIEADPTFKEAYLPYIELLLFYDSKHMALSTMEEANKVNPDWEAGILLQGIISLLLGSSAEEFHKVVDRLLELDPSNYYYYSWKGYLEVELKQYHKAVEYFHKAYTMEGDTIRKGTRRSSRFMKNEAIQRSLDYYYDHFAQEQEVRKHIDRGICEFIIGHKTQALTYLDSALQYESNSVIHTFRGSIFRTSEDSVNLAIDAFTEAIKLDSTNWVAWTYRAEAHLSNDDFPNAYNDFGKVIELRPRFKDGYKNRGIILNNNGYYQNAYRDLSYCIAIDQTDPALFFERAIVSMNMEKYEQAIVDFNQIIEDHPEHGQTYYQIHISYLNLGDTISAIRNLDSASLYSKHKKAYHSELIELSLKHKQIVSTQNGHDRLVKYFSTEYEHRMSRAEFLIQQEEYEKAISDLLEYVRRNRNSGKAYYYLATSSKELGKQEDFNKYLKKAAKLGYYE